MKLIQDDIIFPYQGSQTTDGITKFYESEKEKMTQFQSPYVEQTQKSGTNDTMFELYMKERKRLIRGLEDNK